MSKRGMPRGKGGFGGGGNMNQLMQQAQKMQRELEKAQQETAEMTGEATVGGGFVTVTVGADHQIISLELAPEVIDPEDPEMLQDMVTAAVNEAMRDLDSKIEARMSKVTGGAGLGFPGF
ncbi:MAG: YbaB/EbfC family nucleoid-associated protein [Saccharofermentanales bacterium]|jgi:DNA-binding YbaB/EbfC family protein|nr:YbaB/EbfC family nucleoid-associated protein [Bacillota bacterium]NLB08790.1 YbaB/EbfC family nucleoid-associated protein [Clostridiales bacterium]